MKRHRVRDNRVGKKYPFHILNSKTKSIFATRMASILYRVRDVRFTSRRRKYGYGGIITVCAQFRINHCTLSSHFTYEPNYVSVERLTGP